MTNKVLIVGSSGYLGQNLSQHFSRITHVLGCSRRKQNIPFLTNFDHLLGDYGDTEFLRTIPDVDCIIHAGSPFHPREAVSATDLQNIYDKEANLLKKICALSNVKKLKNVIFLSSAGEVYGNPPALVCNETTTENPITQYGEFKLRVEEMYISALKFENVLSVLRVSNPYGRPQTTRTDRNFINTSVKRALDGLPINIWGDGMQGRDYLFVDDFINAVQACLQKPIDGFRLLNIGCGESTSLIDAAELIIKIVGRGRVDFVKPYFVPPIKKNILDISKARCKLGWNPKYDLAAGIKKSIEIAERRT